MAMTQNFLPTAGVGAGDSESPTESALRAVTAGSSGLPHVSDSTVSRRSVGCDPSEYAICRSIGWPIRVVPSSRAPGGTPTSERAAGLLAVVGTVREDGECAEA